MERSFQNVNNFNEFRRYIETLYPQTDYSAIAFKIWDTYWQGIRDARLHDCGIWLIDRFGY